METATSYVKRSQRDYSLSFKLQVVQEIERGEVSVKSAQRQYGIQGNATVINWLRKYGNFDGAAQETVEIYNEKRPHFSNYVLTPNQMHQQNTIKIRTYKTKNSCNKNATTA